MSQHNSRPPYGQCSTQALIVLLAAPPPHYGIESVRTSDDTRCPVALASAMYFFPSLLAMFTSLTHYPFLSAPLTRLPAPKPRHSVRVSVIMLPETPPLADLSRTRLREIAAWIRDELDPIIAQDGPRRLGADDVLMLHEIFQALRISSTISVLDLRATGIHKAILEVAGTATRWPGRLADDCDRIIAVWTSKFGRLEALRPFMYGRGGRLEGVAKVTEFSEEVR